MLELIHTIPVQNTLGEGVIWDHQRQRIWWTDIDASKLYRLDTVSLKLESWDTPERLCCFAPVQSEECLIAAFASGFAFYQPETQEIDWIAKIEADNPGTRLNDGRTDRQGRFWAGTMVEDYPNSTYKGSLYCVDQQLNIRKTIGGLNITNSLCWSPDSSVMYHCDTPKDRIDWYAFNSATGELGTANEFATTSADSHPDGSIVDADGYLWNAQWGGSKVVRYASDGSVDQVLEMPISQPTCTAFAGENLDLLVVTTARQDLDEKALQQQPLAGDLFIYQTDYKGIAESPFIRAS